VTARALALVAGVAALLAVAVGAFVRCEGSPPTLAGPEEIFLGRAGSSLTLRAGDRGSGLRALRVVLAHAKGEAVLLERGFDGGWLRGGAGEPAEVEVEVDLDAKALGLEPGDAFLRATARDWSWRGALDGNATELEVPVRVDLEPPRIRVRSGLTYVRRGGSAAVAYDLDDGVARDGVEVGGVFFPGSPWPGAAAAPGRRLGLFAIPRDAEAEARVAVVAVDRAGNRRAAGWPTHLQEREFETVRIELPPAFLQHKIPELARELGIDAADPVAAFQKINTEVRAANEAHIREIVAASGPERLWQGAFQQLPNSRVTSRFAEARSYTVADREVSRAIHYGYDLAALAQAPVLASNRGRVLFTGDLGIYGQTVVLDHGGGLCSLYGHLSLIDAAVGDLVEQGQELGRSGETGLAGGDHLHFAILVGGVYADPLEWWDARWVREHVETRLAEG
jgi:murein DD-endopeptidase MepM/ murein hydrolase activator NlpD